MDLIDNGPHISHFIATVLVISLESYHPHPRNNVDKVTNTMDMLLK